jgi:hypothetical protein
MFLEIHNSDFNEDTNFLNETRTKFGLIGLIPEEFTEFDNEFLQESVKEELNEDCICNELKSNWND